MNFYELLKVDSTVSAEEIEARLDDEYTKWRSLVTHHEPEIVAQAEQALEKLEEIRSTLLDPEKRAKYDADISSQQVGMSGLADPDMILASNPVQTGGMAPPRARKNPADVEPSPELDRTDAWICTNPNCKKANPIGTQYCSNCGKVLGYECPSCGILVEFSKRFCFNCGVDKEEYFRQEQENELRRLQEQLNSKTAEMNLINANRDQFMKKNPHLKNNLNGCIAVLIIIFFFMFGGFCGVGVGSEVNEVVGVLLGLIISLVFPIGLILLINRSQRTAKVDKYFRDLKVEVEGYRKRIEEVKARQYDIIE